MAARVNPVTPQTPHIRGRRHRRGLLLVVPALLTAPITGDLAHTLPPVALAASGTFVAAPIAGDLAHTLPALTIAVDGATGDVRGTYRLQPQTPRIIGRRHRRGVLWAVAPRSHDDTVTLALPPVTFAATGTVAVVPVFGQMDPRAPRGAVIRKRALAAARRAQGRRGWLTFQYAPLAVVPTTDINLTVPSLQLAATGTYVSAIIGTLIHTLPPLAQNETSLVEITGTFAAALPPLTSAAGGIWGVTGDLAATLPALTHILGGSAVGIDGTLTLLLAPLTQAGAGTNPDIFGELNYTLAQLQVSTYAPAPRFGVLTFDLPAVGIDLTGATLGASVDGLIELTIPALSWVGYGPAGAIGDLSLTLPALVAQLQQTDFASLRIVGIGDQYLYIATRGDGTPVAYLLRGVDP